MKNQATSGRIGFIRTDNGGAGTVLLILLTIVFLATTVYFALETSKKNDALSKANREISKLAKQLRTAGTTPLKAENQPAATPAAPNVSELEQGQQLQAAQKQIARLQRKLSSIEKEKARLLAQQNQSEENRIASIKKDFAAKINAANAKIAELSDKLEEAERNLASARNEISAKQKEIADLKARLQQAETARKRLLEQVKEMTDRSTQLITSLTRSNEELSARVSDLEKALRQYPEQPLSDDAAHSALQKLNETLSKTDDPHERVRIAFKAKQKLAGSRYERNADSIWKRETQALKRTVEAAGTAAYKEALSALRSHPDDHTQNVELLEKALVKAKGSRMEGRLKALLEKEIRALQKAKAEASAEASKMGKETPRETSPSKTTSPTTPKPAENESAPSSPTP